MTPRSSAGPSQVSNTTPLAAAAAGGGYGHPPVDPRHGYADPRYGGAQQPTSVNAQYPAELSQYPQHPQQYSGYASSAAGWSGNAGATSQVQSGAMHGMSIHHSSTPPSRTRFTTSTFCRGRHQHANCSFLFALLEGWAMQQQQQQQAVPQVSAAQLPYNTGCVLLRPLCSLFSATKTRFLPPCGRQ